MSDIPCPMIRIGVPASGVEIRVPEPTAKEISDLWYTCIHEAGHVVGAAVAGAEVLSAKASHSGGIVHHSRLDGEAAAITAACGPKAKPLFLETTPPRRTRQWYSLEAVRQTVAAATAAASAVDDFAVIWNWVMQREDTYLWSSRREEVMVLATDLIRRNRRCVLRLAEALFAKGELDGEEIRDILKEHGLVDT